MLSVPAGCCLVRDIILLLPGGGCRPFLGAAIFNGRLNASRLEECEVASFSLFHGIRPLTMSPRDVQAAYNSISAWRARTNYGFDFPPPPQENDVSCGTSTYPMRKYLNSSEAFLLLFQKVHAQHQGGFSAMSGVKWAQACLHLQRALITEV